MIPSAGRKFHENPVALGHFGPILAPYRPQIAFAP
jgi:hypothetical protein